MSKNNRFALAFIGCLAISMTTAPSRAEAPAPAAPPLSLESTILFAVTQNPGIKAEVEKIKQANSAIKEARAAYYPQVSLNLRGGHEYDDPAALPAGSSVVDKVPAELNSYDAGLVINQVLFNGFATDEEVERRKSLMTSATYGSLVAIEGVLHNAIEYYTNVWRYQRAVVETQSFVESLQKTGAKIKLMNEAGAESKAKREYVESRVANAETELNTAKASLADALSSLEALTGPLPVFTAQRPLQMDPTLRKLDSYYQLARADNNRLKLNSSDRDAVEHQIKEADAAYLPTVGVELDGRHGYDVGGHVGNTWNASAMLTMDYKLFDGFARDATEDRLKSQKAETEFRQKQLELDTDKDIRKSYNQILAAKQDLSSNMKEIMSSENLQDLYQKQFELGEGDIITMIEGAERLHGARLSSFKLESNIVMDSYTLLQTAGALRKERFCASC